MKPECPFKNKGSKLDASNYRPISLLSTISKLCERIMYNHLYTYLSPVLHPSQSGFRKGDSTSWQLLRLVQSMSSVRENGHYSMLCFFDLSKAFDTVWTRGLLYKLCSVCQRTCTVWSSSGINPGASPLSYVCKRSGRNGSHITIC